MNTELCDFVKLVIERMDTFPEEFNEGPKQRWNTLTRGLIDIASGETDSMGARALWALEPYEIEALTTKFKVIYLEQQKRAFLKNILGAEDEHQSKKVLVTNPKSMLVPSAMVKEATKILRDEMDKVYATNTLGHSNNTNAYEYGQRHLREPNK
jgi:hypothetical protein